ncbi:MAG TPA: RNA-binding protein [Blastocatellia bacterium]|nr:RNA-binding protein [Blastocatellia bacterium]
MTVRLFVGNLPYNATEATLREYFSAVGPLSYVSLPTDRTTGKPRGFAFVEFGDRAQAEEAIRRFNNQLFMGRQIAVNEARERDNRPRPASSMGSYAPSRELNEPPARSERTGPSFGPDAAPRRSRRPGGRGQSSDRPPKQPIREKTGGRFFGESEDDGSDDDLSGDNFASRVSDSDTE